jgi:hypothetical protein
MLWMLDRVADQCITRGNYNWKYRALMTALYTAQIAALGWFVYAVCSLRLRTMSRLPRAHLGKIFMNYDLASDMIQRAAMFQVIGSIYENPELLN